MFGSQLGPNYFLGADLQQALFEPPAYRGFALCRRLGSALRSEYEMSTKLNLSWRPVCSAHDAEIRVPEGRVWIRIMGRVGEIESIGLDADLHTFPQLN
jgi:hypothetical protein